MFKKELNVNDPAPVAQADGKELSAWELLKLQYAEKTALSKQLIEKTIPE